MIAAPSLPCARTHIHKRICNIKKCPKSIYCWNEIAPLLRILQKLQPKFTYAHDIRLKCLPAHLYTPDNPKAGKPFPKRIIEIFRKRFWCTVRDAEIQMRLKFLCSESSAFSKQTLLNDLWTSGLSCSDSLITTTIETRELDYTSCNYGTNRRSDINFIPTYSPHLLTKDAVVRTQLFYDLQALGFRF